MMKRKFAMSKTLKINYFVYKIKKKRGLSPPKKTPKTHIHIMKTLFLNFLSLFDLMTHTPEWGHIFSIKFFKSPKFFQ